MKFSLVAILVLSLSPVTGAQENPPSAPPGKFEPVRQNEITPQTEAAIARALDWLARKQSTGGYISGSYPVATTSVTCIAFLASGSTPHSGKYALNIRRGLDYVRAMCGKSGFITDGGNSGMYGHGYATLLLAESLGMIRDAHEIELTRDTLTRAVELLERSQNQFGGWNTAPDGTATDDGSGAIAIMQITALRAARNAGVQVNPKTIERAKKYVGEMTSAEGWYAYNYHARNGGHRSSALTGAGMYMLGVMDAYTDPRYEKGIRNLMTNAPFLGKGASGDQGWQGWWFYTCFYSSLAVFQHGGDEWRRWYPAMRDELIRKQSRDGSWPGDSYGGLFSAFAVLSLELPYRYLPVFQEGGKGREGT